MGSVSEHLEGAVVGGSVGGYRLVQRVGEGGMGVVYLALDGAGRAVALKVLREAIAADPEARARLAREVHSLQRVSHPLVAEVLDADLEGPHPFLVTRFVAGESLARRVDRVGALGPVALRRLGAGLIDALDAIHAADVVHRDLKPGNVVLLDDDPVVIDFGIARAADDLQVTSAGLVTGTPGFIAPEVLDGDPGSEASDWWGWAATVAFAATGRPVFGRGPTEAVLDRERRERADLEGVPGPLAGLLLDCLAADPAGRPDREEIAGRFSALPPFAAPGAVPGPAVTEVLPAGAVEPPAERPVEPPAATEVLADPTRALAPPPPAVPSAVPAGPPPGYPAPAGPPPGYPAPPVAAVPRRPRRAGSVVALLVLVWAVGLTAPVVAVLALVGWSAVAHVADRFVLAGLRRRAATDPFGPVSRPAGWQVALAAPWHLLTGLALAALALLAPALLGGGTTALAATLLGQGGGRRAEVVVGGVALGGGVVALALGGAVALLLVALGPGGAAWRRGSAVLFTGLAPGRAGAVVVTLLALGVAAWIVLAVVPGGTPSWWPLDAWAGQSGGGWCGVGALRWCP